MGSYKRREGETKDSRWDDSDEQVEVGSGKKSI
jgi:stalled ribosome alternative rescue factor ArfA